MVRVLKMTHLMLVLLVTLLQTFVRTDPFIQDEWILLLVNYTAHLFFLKRNEIMPFAAILMHLEITILSEVSQTEKDK